MTPNNDSIIVIAWPQTRVVKVDMWYDVPMRWLGINQEEYYKAGHSAAILVNHSTSELCYFDFGRYHTSPKFGRIRDKETDPDLALHCKPKFTKDRSSLINHEEIISELTQNPGTHGEGKTIYSVYSGIDYQLAYNYAKKQQLKGQIPYGPFDLRGTNCSRFVANLINSGNPDRITKARLKLPWTVTASPILNVKITNQNGALYTNSDNINQPINSFIPERNPNRTLQSPVKPSILPENAVWHSGEGAGSWFSIVPCEDSAPHTPTYKVTRYSPNGQLEFESIFILKKGNKTLIVENGDYNIDYVSHAKQIQLSVEDELLLLVSGY